jgi:hypothetical protein
MIYGTQFADHPETGFRAIPFAYVVFSFWPQEKLHGKTLSDTVGNGARHRGERPTGFRHEWKQI